MRRLVPDPVHRTDSHHSIHVSSQVRVLCLALAQGNPLQSALGSNVYTSMEPKAIDHSLITSDQSSDSEGECGGAPSTRWLHFIDTHSQRARVCCDQPNPPDGQLSRPDDDWHCCLEMSSLAICPKCELWLCYYNIGMGFVQTIYICVTGNVSATGSRVVE